MFYYFADALHFFAEPSYFENLFQAWSRLLKAFFVTGGFKIWSRKSNISVFSNIWCWNLLNAFFNSVWDPPGDWGGG